METTRYLPRPGRENTVSVTTAPPRSMPYWMPMVVRVGAKAFLSACLVITFHSLRPLARAWVTYSRRSTSSMEERTMRATTAAMNRPRVMAGKIM